MRVGFDTGGTRRAVNGSVLAEHVAGREVAEGYGLSVGRVDAAIIINSSWMIDGMIARERCFVAECGGMLVGWGGWAPRAAAHAWLDRNRRCPPPHAELRALYVDPEWIRLGFARRLLTQIESDMAANGHRQVDLIAMMHSIAFFRRLGYGGDKVREAKLPRDVPFRWLDMSKALEPSPSPVLGTG
jgi:ribosomal protein S18 acetylase RimI-like enzyme